MTTNEAAEAAKAVQRAWRISKLVLGAYLVTGTLALCWVAVADPALVVNGTGLCLAVVVGILAPQVILYRYRMARGKKLAEVTWDTERYDLTSPDAYYHTSHGYEKSRAGSYGTRRTDALWSAVFYRYLPLMFAGFFVAGAVAAAVINHEPTATTTATVTQCGTGKGSTISCTGTWTVAGKAYSAMLWTSANTHGRPEPAVGSPLTVTYNTRYPSVLGKQSISDGATAAVLTGLIGSGLSFWSYSRYKPYRAELDAIAAGRGAAATARQPAPDKPPARDGRRTSKKRGSTSS
jgi:hypothetical protein